jgi:hypothetical protein
MKEKKIKLMRLRIFIFVLVFLFTTTTVQASPNSKIAYAFSKSGEHYFLIQNDSSLFGNNITIIHNCDSLEFKLNQTFYASSNASKFKLNIEPGIYEIEMLCDNVSIQYSNVVFYPDQLQWINQYNQLQNDKFEGLDVILKEEASKLANWSAFWGILIVWLLSTYVYWNLINHYVQRNFIEEVIE